MTGSRVPCTKRRSENARSHDTGSRVPSEILLTACSPSARLLTLRLCLLR